MINEVNHIEWTKTSQKSLHTVLQCRLNKKCK